MKEIIDYQFLGNTVLEYLLMFSGLVVTFAILRITKRRLLNLMKKISIRTSTHIDDLIVDASEKFLIPYFYLLINYNIITTLKLSSQVEKILHAGLLFATIYYAVKLVNFVIYRSLILFMEQKKESPERIKQLDGMIAVLKVITWATGLMLLVDNLGYNITTIIAGLGVGGIAIALAAQNIIGDLFSYLVIFFDKPFEVGDFIIVGNNSGVVEKIGIKTSHVRSLDGQQLIMPNSEMAKSVIQNYKRLERRRITFAIGVVYYTPAYKLRNIPLLVKKIITKCEHATYDRAHFKLFGDFSINYEIVYYVESADYLLFMDLHHEICMNIFEQFEKEGIEFAFPTQTLFLNHQNVAAENQISN